MTAAILQFSLFISVYSLSHRHNFLFLRPSPSLSISFSPSQDGLVTQYHKSGKHCVEFHVAHQKRWLPMLKTAFFIVERPLTKDHAESKEPEGTEHNSSSSSSSLASNSNASGTASRSPGGGSSAAEQDAIYGLAPIDKWAYCEEITIEYARAQATLHKVYGGKIQETGHRTEGHVCVLEEDREVAKSTKGSLLYGELLPRGVNRALDSRHLDATRQSTHTLLDMGMGTGKVVMQVFLQCLNLTDVYGVELSPARYRLAEAAALRMVDLERLHDGSPTTPPPPPSSTPASPTTSSMTAGDPSGSPEDEGGNSSSPSTAAAAVAAAPSPQRTGVPRFEVIEHVAGRLLRVRDRLPRRDGKLRVLTLEWNNLLDAPPALVADADFVLLETDIPGDVMLRLACQLYTLKAGARLLSYLDLHKVWDTGSNGSSSSLRSAPFVQLEANKTLADRYPTSWSVHRGHHFFIWCKQAAARPHMYEYYTQRKRLAPDQPPPYPPYVSSYFSGRSFFSRRPPSLPVTNHVTAPTSPHRNNDGALAQSNNNSSPSSNSSGRVRSSIDVNWSSSPSSSGGGGGLSGCLGLSGTAVGRGSQHSVVSTGGLRRSPPGTSLDLSETSDDATAAPNTTTTTVTSAAGEGGVEGAGGSLAARAANHRQAAAHHGDGSNGNGAGASSAAAAGFMEAPPRRLPPNNASTNSKSSQGGHLSVGEGAGAAAASTQQTNSQSAASTAAERPGKPSPGGSCSVM
jgi:hypothetical protein